MKQSILLSYGYENIRALNEKELTEMERIIKDLSDDLYTTCLMYFEGYTIIEIADYKKISIESVQNKVNYFLRTIHERFECHRTPYH